MPLLPHCYDHEMDQVMSFPSCRSVVKPQQPESILSKSYFFVNHPSHISSPLANHRRKNSRTQLPYENSYSQLSSTEGNPTIKICWQPGWAALFSCLRTWIIDLMIKQSSGSPKPATVHCRNTVDCILLFTGDKLCITCPLTHLSQFHLSPANHDIQITTSFA